MRKKYLIAAMMLVLSCTGIQAQRPMDKLDRGLVAVKTTGGVYCSWRITGDEYYDVKYNLYRDGQKVNDEPLNVSNYTDKSGAITSEYTVKAVVRGVEQGASKAVKPWSQDYLVIPKAKRTSNDGTTDITNSYEPNDATIGDVDGDGEMEIIVKQINDDDKVTTSDIDFDRIEVYKLDGTLLWWIDCGPNLWDFQHNETNIAVYDWDQDGKAEAVMRAADGTVIHAADGQTYVVGDKTKNYRAGVYNFINDGAEYLVYMNGETGVPYSISDYPLKRLESGETGTEAAWGDGYGHRASKHFFGAPYLDGKHPSIFLARGIYTRHKMIAYDVDPATHKLTERWRWFNNTPGAWYGQGYHNYTIADVDIDGRDEICYGSMVIDDNGKGLSTTGLGHGDAQHWGDLDPYKHGLEVFACNETSPANNYRDATTSKIYYRKAGGSDDGRCMAGNFTNNVPGAIGGSAHDTYISCVAADHADGVDGTGIDMNFRIYWDGDLLEETFNGAATRNSNGVIHKYGSWTPIKTFNNTITNNDSKATPCFQGDIFGDWREEVVMRDDNNNMRIEFSTIPTDNRVYTLLHDPQYRNAMVWQMCGYNQPPHVSYFMGELEGIVAPPAPMTNGKNVVAKGGTISAALNDASVLTDEVGDATYTVAEGASPYIYFDNTPSWVQGHDNNDNITYTYYTHELTGAAFTGNTRIVKQGDGALTLPKARQTYTGNTDVWAGIVNFDGEMPSSHVWLNRFAELNSDGGKFGHGITMEYGSILRPGGKNNIGTMTVDSLDMRFGSRVVFDINDNTKQTDHLVADTLLLEKKDWKVAPKYVTPVIQINPTYKDGMTRLEAGTYELIETKSITGNIENVIVEGISNQKASLSVVDGKVILTIADQREATTVKWSGVEGNDWDMLTTENFTTASSGDKNNFVTGDAVIFDDDAVNTTVNVTAPMSPASITFDNNTKNYTVSGDSIIGNGGLTKKGSATVYLQNINRFSGTTNINDGTVNVVSLANNTGNDFGALGGVSNTIRIDGGTLATTQEVITDQQISIGTGDATISTPSASGSFTLHKAITSFGGRNNLIKTGAGSLSLADNNNLKTITMRGGTLTVGSSAADTLKFYSGTVWDNGNGTSNYDVENNGSLYLNAYCTYTGRLVGSGTFTVYAAGVRNFMNGDWSKFTGTLRIRANKRGSYDPVYSINNNYGLPLATVDVGDGVYVDADANGARRYTNRSYTFGNLTGSGTINHNSSTSVSLTVGTLNEDYDFQGTLNGINLTKVGSGNWLLSTANNQESLSSLTIRGGELRMNDTRFATTYLGGMTITVADSGAVKGRGELGSLTVNKGGTVAPGSYVGSRPTGELRLTGSLTAYAGSQVNFFIVNAKNNSYSRSFITADDGHITINGDINVNMSDNYEPLAGDSIVLWSTGRFTGRPTVNLPELPNGLKWDTTDLLANKGILRIVADATSIESIPAYSQYSCDVYTTGGTFVGNITSTRESLSRDVRALGHGAGVYIVKMNVDGKVLQLKVAVK